jgi:hypothetical protein
MVLDVAGWHQANDLRIPENMCLLPLPPYSPDLNPVEHLWEEIRDKWFPYLVFDSLAGVEDRRVEALAALERMFTAESEGCFACKLLHADEVCDSRAVFCA